MATFSGLPNYDGDTLDGSEVLGIDEDDAGATQGITTQQLIDLLPSINGFLTLKGNIKKFLRFDRTSSAAVGNLFEIGIKGGASGGQGFDFRLGDGTTLATIESNGSVNASTKNFLIDHPSPDKKETHTLRHGSLEGPENGVYQRGTLDASGVIALPSYWPHLVDSATITVNLTALGGFQKLYVKSKGSDEIEVGIDGGTTSDIRCDYTVYAERKDVDPLVVEEEK